MLETVQVNEMTMATPPKTFYSSPPFPYPRFHFLQFQLTMDNNEKKGNIVQ
jgi:hypothetical protein